MVFISINNLIYRTEIQVRIFFVVFDSPIIESDNMLLNKTFWILMKRSATLFWQKSYKFFCLFGCFLYILMWLYISIISLLIIDSLILNYIKLDYIKIYLKIGLNSMKKFCNNKKKQFTIEDSKPKKIRTFSLETNI